LKDKTLLLKFHLKFGHYNLAINKDFTLNNQTGVLEQVDLKKFAFRFIILLEKMNSLALPWEKNIESLLSFQKREYYRG